jgi:hypothetical protein
MELKKQDQELPERFENLPRIEKARIIGIWENERKTINAIIESAKLDGFPICVYHDDKYAIFKSNKISTVYLYTGTYFNGDKWINTHSAYESFEEAIMGTVFIVADGRNTQLPYYVATLLKALKAERVVR